MVAINRGVPSVSSHRLLPLISPGNRTQTNRWLDRRTADISRSELRSTEQNAPAHLVYIVVADINRSNCTNYGTKQSAALEQRTRGVPRRREKNEINMAAADGPSTSGLTLLASAFRCRVNYWARELVAQMVSGNQRNKICRCMMYVRKKHIKSTVYRHLPPTTSIGSRTPDSNASSLINKLVATNDYSRIPGRIRVMA